jgi:hypothetical protein
MLASRVSRTRAVLLVGLLLSGWAGALHARAALAPPPGRTFAGAFHWIDDFYNYVSYAQQAEDGRFLMRNRLLDPAPARPQMVNLEWWSVGRLSAALGRRPLLAYRILAVLATLALVGAAERWLTAAGVPRSHRLAALWLVFLGGGLGGVLFEATDLPVRRCLDLSLGAFPYLEVLANPHFAAGTALLAWALWCFACVPAPRGPLLGIVLGTVLGLVRPYDLALLGLVRAVSVLAARPRDRWTHELLPLAGLLPVLAYDVWLFFGTDQFASFHRGSATPPWVDFLPAFGPAALLALTSLRDRVGGEPAAREARVHLWTWPAAAFLVALSRPGAFALQLLVGTGMPMLVLGAAALRRRPVTATVLATLLLSSAFVVQTRIVMSEDPNWFVPRERMAAAEALRPRCRNGGRVLAPPDIGLYTIGLTACSTVVSHSLAPDYAERLAEVDAFYVSQAPAERRALLDREGVTHVVLPGYAGPAAEAWLGPGAPFVAVPMTGAGRAIAVYERARPAAPQRPAPARRRDATSPARAAPSEASDTASPTEAAGGR